MTFVIQNDGASYPTSLTAATCIQQVLYMDSLAKFLMKLSQRHHLLQIAISDVITGCQDRFQGVADFVSVLIADRMTQSGINEAIVADICSIEGSLRKPFVWPRDQLFTRKVLSQKLSLRSEFVITLQYVLLLLIFIM